MTTQLRCHRLSYAIGANWLFRNLELTLNSGDRIGLVGHNGSGKSTLFSLLNDTRQADEGEISRSNDLHLETVEQFIDPRLDDATLFEALAEKLPVEERSFSEYRVEMLLEQLGFQHPEYGYKVGNLSGGQQNRLMFARAVLNEPNMILFDEPTNHLDLKTILYFEDYLEHIDAAYLLISHDREFLDRVTNRTLFLRDQRLYSIALPYSAARRKLEAQDLAAVSARAEEEKQIRSLKASARRLATWGRVYDNEKLARKAKSMEKRIAKMEDDKTFVTRDTGLKLSLEVGRSRANRMLQIEGQQILSPGENPQPLFFVDDFFIRPGDRVALLGHNGVGKTTLIKLIMNQYQSSLEDEEVVRFNPQCEIGYYDQELERLDPDRTLMETLRDHCHGLENDYKAALIRAGFPYRDLNKIVGVTSGGERARLMFLIIKLNRPNFLILDEPTNHIDIQGKEDLENQLLESQATLLITSHDRRFVDNIAQRFVLIQHGQLREIDDPAEFHESDRESPSIPGTPPPDPATGEEILQKIIKLEEKLAADLQRKPKFQKPNLQAEWQAEIDRLNCLLEAR